jgi:hypothetical protein
VHTSSTKSLKVYSDTYSQFRAIGQAHRDESVAQGYSSAQMLIEISSPPREDGRDAISFDLFILNDQSDYECYIRSTEILD